MYCPICDWDYPTDPDFELSGKGVCPGCGAKYGMTGTGSLQEDDGHHETGADAGEGDSLLDEMMDEDANFGW